MFRLQNASGLASGVTATGNADLLAQSTLRQNRSLSSGRTDTARATQRTLSLFAAALSVALLAVILVAVSSSTLHANALHAPSVLTVKTDACLALAASLSVVCAVLASGALAFRHVLPAMRLDRRHAL